MVHLLVELAVSTRVDPLASRQSHLRREWRPEFDLRDVLPVDDERGPARPVEGPLELGQGEKAAAGVLHDGVVAGRETNRRVKTILAGARGREGLQVTSDEGKKVGGGGNCVADCWCCVGHDVGVR